MARRGGRLGDWLATDDYTGFTRYASELRKDFWGALAQKPLLRNLQEISTPLEDPYPVNPVRGPSYEVAPVCLADTAPIYVGNTTVPTSNNNMGMQVLGLDLAIPEMEISCTFIIR